MGLYNSYTPSPQNELPSRNVLQADNLIISLVGVIDVIDRARRLQNKAAHLNESMKNEIITNLRYAREEGTDHPEISNSTSPG
jgi:phosphoketolase